MSVPSAAEGGVIDGAAGGLLRGGRFFRLSRADGAERRGDLVVLAVLERADVEQGPLALDAAKDGRRSRAQTRGERFERERRVPQRDDLGRNLLGGHRAAAELAGIVDHLERK